LLLLLVVWLPLAAAFSIAAKAPRSSVLNMVSIGLGPDETKEWLRDVDTLVAGVDYDIPNHEEYRLSRRSKLDEQCDIWFERLVSAPEGLLKGPIAELTNDVPLPHDDPDKLPWTPLTPAYRLEQFGIPTPRRNAKTWRHFVVPGMISQDYSSPSTATMVDTAKVQQKLMDAGVWLDNDDVEAPLVYINGHFDEALSLSSHVACNSNAAHLDDDKVSRYLCRLTDGFTDTLMAPVSLDGYWSLTSLATLSGPNQNVGPATEQFA
jgi:hypothetical protein